VQSSRIRYETIRSTAGHWATPGELRWDGDKQEIEVFRSAPDADVEFKAKVTLYVGFADIEGLEGRPVLETLFEMKGIVQSILVAVEAEAIRLGLFKQ